MIRKNCTYAIKQMSWITWYIDSHQFTWNITNLCDKQSSIIVLVRTKTQTRTESRTTQSTHQKHTRPRQWNRARHSGESGENHCEWLPTPPPAKQLSLVDVVACGHVWPRTVLLWCRNRVTPYLAPCVVRPIARTQKSRARRISHSNVVEKAGPNFACYCYCLLFDVRIYLNGMPSSSLWSFEPLQKTQLASQ